MPGQGNLVLKSLKVKEVTPTAGFKVVSSPGFSRTKHGRCGPFVWRGLRGTMRPAEAGTTYHVVQVHL
jgi:hypothetical protein